MDTGTWTLVIGGMIGLLLILLGVRMLVSGKGPASTIRAFRSMHDAGMYHLLFGTGLILLVAGARLPGDAPGVVTAVLAVLLAGLAVARYRPRGKREVEE